MAKKSILLSMLVMLMSNVDLFGMATCCSINPAATSIIPTLPNGVKSIAFTSGGCLVTVNDLGEVNVYTPTSNPCVYATSTGEIDLGAQAFGLASSPSGCIAVATDSGITVLEPIGSCANCVYAPSATMPTILDTTVVAFSNDNCLASGDVGGNVTIYSAAPGTCTYNTPATPTFTIPIPAQISALAFSPVNNCLVVGDVLGNVNTYAQISGCSYTITPSLPLVAGLGNPITSIAFDSAGCLAIADNSGQVTIYQPGAGCSFTPALPIIVGVAPMFVAFSPLNSCLAVGSADGSISTYSPMGGCAYNSSPVSVIPGGTPVAAVAYSPNGCLAVGGANSVNIYEPNMTLATIISPEVSFVCFGQTILLHALTLGGTGSYTYVWTLPDGSTVSTGLSNTLTVPNATEANSGLYTVEVTDSAECQATGRAFVEVLTINTSLQAMPETICSGQSTTLSTNISGGLPPYTVTFTGFAPIVTAGPLVTQIATPLATTNYSVTVVDSRGCSVTTGPITVTVKTPTAPIIGTQIVNCNGTITITGTGTSGDLVEVFNGPNQQIAVPVSVANDGTFTITTIPLAPGTYTNLSLTAVAALNCSASTQIPSVIIPSAVGVSIAPNPSIVCAGSSIALTATGTGGTPPYTYVWTGPGGFMAMGDMITIPNATRAMAGIYNVTLTDANGCTTSASVLVRVVDIGVTLSSSDAVICGGSSATLTAIVTSGVPPYTFTFSDGFVVTTPTTSAMHLVIPAMTTSYTVTVVDSTPCSAISASNMIVVNLVIPPSNLTSSSNCNGTVSITGTATPGNIITVFNGAIPVGGPIIVPVSGNFSLNTSALPAGTYTLDVTATNATGCTATTPAPAVVVNPAFSVTIAPPAQSIPAGTLLNLTANTLGGSPGATIYAWTGPNGFTQTGPSNMVVRPNATASFVGTYNVIATDSAGCTASGSATVTVS